MKLLLDQNLSPRLVSRLTDLSLPMLHVSDAGLASAQDDEIWMFARSNDYVIVTKDADFGEKAIQQGFPPKVVWIRRGNCSTADIEVILRNDITLIERFFRDPNLGVLELY
jgi:predicted nuclease of predicted toxin-antitoxin system